MSNPIPHSNIFATPENFQELEEHLNSYDGATKGAVWMAAMLTLNLAHKLVEESKQPA